MRSGFKFKKIYENINQEKLTQKNLNKKKLNQKELNKDKLHQHDKFGNVVIDIQIFKLKHKVLVNF